MKLLSAAFTEHLEGRATTMCSCWKVTRSDGLEQGFTDHDVPLTFDGLTYEAATGYTASQVQSSLGLAVDNLEVQSALSSSAINEDDLARGLYDNAAIELFWVNWRDTSIRDVISRGTIGEVTRSGTAFTAELRGLSNRLQQKSGRRYQRYCDAVVGDSRCGVDLVGDFVYNATAEVISVNTNKSFQINVTSLAGNVGTPDDWFTSGVLTWQTGDNALGMFEIKLQSKEGTNILIELWQAPADTVEVGDTFSMTAGCKGDSVTCNAKFRNIANFRGFNLIPGPDMLLFYPEQGDENLDGQSLWLERHNIPDSAS